MDPIRSFCGRLRALAGTLDRETARLQQALDGNESDVEDFEDYPMRILHDLHSEVWALKDNVNTLLDKTRLESQESIGFIKATKVLMKKNAVDIIKIKEFFQKYGYNPRVKENSVCEQETSGSVLEMSQENVQESDTKDDLFTRSALSGSGPDKPLRSPQLSDFGLERYMISQALPNAPQAVNRPKEEPVMETPPTRQSLVKILKTPKCALKMDNFECVTPKLEHFGISEYTMCLNDDYTVALKNTKNIKSEETIEVKPTTGDDHFIKPTTSDDCFDTPGPIIQQLEKSDTKYMNSPLAPTFCTPGLKIPSTKNNTALISTNNPLPKTHNSLNDLDTPDRASSASSSDGGLGNLADPSSPMISSYESLLRTPTPPEVTAIPYDVLQILSKYNSNLATPVVVKAAPPRKGLPRHEEDNFQEAGGKENWGK
ncbi:spindle and kinetochore-associated protein 3 [Ctenodactylus gundi]